MTLRAYSLPHSRIFALFTNRYIPIYITFSLQKHVLIHNTKSRLSPVVYVHIR